MPAPAQLTEFIRQGFARGVSRDQITQVLLENQWQMSDINAGFDEVFYAPVSASPGQIQPAQRMPTPSTYPEIASLSKQESSGWIGFMSIFLGMLIIVGVVLLFTQNTWVPTVVAFIQGIESRKAAEIQNTGTPTQAAPSQTGGADSVTNDTIREANITAIRKSLNAYFNNQNTYPASLDDLVPNYLPVMPTDPFTQEPYSYEPSGDGSDFKLCALLSTGSQYCVDEIGIESGP